jgi:hypothetical protein
MIVKNVLDEETRKMFLFEMAKQRGMYWGIKAIFPHMNKSIIGQSSVDTANSYKARGYFFKLVFLRPLTESDIERNNEISRWMNENYVVRLYALLNSYKIVSGLSSVDESIDGSKEVKLLIRLRNVFAHTSGKYNPEDERQRDLFKDIVAHIKLNEDESNEIRLDIDKVLDPLHEGCLRYVEGKFKK